MNQQERNPCQVLGDCIQQRPRSEAVLEHREAEISGAGEDDCACQPDLETVLVVAIDL